MAGAGEASRKSGFDPTLGAKSGGAGAASRKSSLTPFPTGKSGGAGAASRSSGFDPTLGAKGAGAASRNSGLTPFPSGSSSSGKKSKKGLFGQLVDTVRGLPAGLGHVVLGLGKELAPTNPLAEFGKDRTGKTPGWHNVKENMPITAELVTSPVRTVREVPDTIVAQRPSFIPGVSQGPGFGKSMLGKELQEHGYLSTGLAKAADVATIAGGLGLLGKGLGAGRLAEVDRLGQLATDHLRAAGIAKDVAKSAKSADVGKLALEAHAAGDVAKAEKLITASAHLKNIEGLMARGAPTLGEKLTLGATKTMTGGARLAGSPAEVYTKAIPAALRKLGVTPAVAKSVTWLADTEAGANLAAKAAKVGQALHLDEASRDFRARYSREVDLPFTKEAHHLFKGTEEATKLLPELHEQQAALLILSGDAKALAPIRALAPAEQAHVLRSLPEGITPEAFTLATDFVTGQAEAGIAGRLEQGINVFREKVLAPQQERYLTGYGTRRELTDKGLAQRAEQIGNDVLSGPQEAVAAKYAEKRQTVLSKAQKRADGTRRVSGESQKLAESRAAVRSLNELQVAQLDAIKTLRRDAGLKTSAEAERAIAERLRTGQAQDVARIAERGENRVGGIIGRGRAQIETARQLGEGEASRVKQNLFAAKRLEKSAAKTDTALTDLQQRVVSGERVPVERLDRTAAKAGNAQIAADEAGAKVLGVNRPRSLASIRQSIDSQAKRSDLIANSESSAVSKSLGRQAKRYEDRAARLEAKIKSEGSSAELQSQLKAEQRSALATRKQIRDHEANLSRIYDKRLADTVTLRRIGEKETAELAKVADKVTSAPAKYRNVLLHSRDATKALGELRDAAEAAVPGSGQLFDRIAADIPTTLAKLDEAGVSPEFLTGRKVTEASGRTSAGGPRVPRRLSLASEKVKSGEAMHTSFVEQAKAATDELRTATRNEFSKHLGEDMGVQGSAVAKGQTGKELAATADAAGLESFDPLTGGRVPTENLTADTLFLPKQLREYSAKYLGPDGNFEKVLKQVYDKPTRVWKHTVLAFSPKWHVGNLLTNTVLLPLGAGVGPAEMVRHFNAARKMVASGEHPFAEHGILATLESGHTAFPAGSLAGPKKPGRLARAAGKSYAFNEAVDSLGKSIVYLSKKGQGLSDETAVALALKAGGDFVARSKFERQVIRRLFPFAAWQKHISTMAVRLPVTNPVRVAWTLRMADMGLDRSDENELEGSIKIGDKYLSLRDFGPLGQAYSVDPNIAKAAFSLNPVLKLGIAAATGRSANREFNPIYRPGQDYGANAAALITKPGVLGRVAAQSVPQIQLIEKLLSDKTKYETGQGIPGSKRDTSSLAEVLKQLGIVLPGPGFTKAKKSR